MIKNFTYGSDYDPNQGLHLSKHKSSWLLAESLACQSKRLFQAIFNFIDHFKNQRYLAL